MTPPRHALAPLLGAANAALGLVLMILLLFAARSTGSSSPSTATPPGAAAGFDAGLQRALRQGLEAGRAPEEIATLVHTARQRGVWHSLPPALRTRAHDHVYAGADAPAALATLVALCSLLLLIGFAVLHRLRAGPAPVDPQAETLENVEPLDVDTRDVTIAATTTAAGASDPEGGPPQG
ncbi:MAG: hypothetical protein ACOCYP_02585 [Planctomycetota bacterium]